MMLIHIFEGVRMFTISLPIFFSIIIQHSHLPYYSALILVPHEHFARGFRQPSRILE